MKLTENGNYKNGSNDAFRYDDAGDNHYFNGKIKQKTTDALNLNDEAKMAKIQHHFAEIMNTLGLDLSDDSLKDTPKRVAKMYVQELFQGLKPENKPRMSMFENSFRYSNMLVEKNIRLRTLCEHHFMPIFGSAHVAYISSGKVIGLSKLNRIVDYYARRPQVQERLNQQIFEDLQKSLSTDDVIVLIEAKHLCVAARGIQDEMSSTITMSHGGKFNDPNTRNEFISLLRNDLMSPWK